MEIRDPVHGFVELYDEEAAIVDHPVFQRLRGVHQLAMAYLVYPGATHTRFEHSLGVLYIADRLARRLELDDDSRRAVRLAALVHDLGHGPFSHISELPLAVCSAPTVQGHQLEKLHEQITIDIIRHILLRDRLITRRQLDALENILDTVRIAQRSVERDIVSGPLDADKLDYLLRDSHHVGVRYGVYDLDRVVQAVQPLKDESGSYMAVSEEDVPAVDQLIIARHHMTMNVYRHRIRRIADAMLVRAILLSISEGNTELGALYTYPGTRAARQFVAKFVDFDDDKLVNSVLNGPEGQGKQLMKRLLERRLLKEVFREPLNRCGATELVEKTVSGGEDRTNAQKEVEARIATICRVMNPEEVFVDLVRSKPPRKTSAEPMIDPESIHVVRRGNSRTTYDKASQFFRHGELRGDDFLCVYMPVDVGDRTRRANKVEQVRKKLAKMFVVGEE